jgi:4-diphosphocytidyl-2-C-methyl-D-erythritol kinase
MSGGASRVRRARVQAPAKINLDLRVLGKRPDGYHELRTIFQTVSLADSIEIAFTPARKTSIHLEDGLAIPDNLVTRAAVLVMEAMRTTGAIEMRLKKRIPMGAGLGGGSSDAAAVLLALPVLAGRALPLDRLCALAQELGSDVPFFLLGGTAAAIGRGTELFPLPDVPPARGLVVAPAIHVNTAEAYRHLSPRLTSESQENKIFSFQSHTWELGGGGPAANDFEPVVFEQHSCLATLKARLAQAGASPALMSGSGSALFGLFHSGADVARAIKSLGSEAGELRAFQISLVSRARYRGMWWRALQDHINGRIWPPHSRYCR